MDNNQIPEGSIVVGVDGSPASDRAVAWGATQAHLEHRPLVLAHGASPTTATTWMGSAGINPAILLEAIAESGRAQLEHAVALAREQDPELEMHQVFDRRDPRDVLLSLSDRAALVVLGSRGRGPMASLLLGSVSLAVSQHARSPVVVLRPDDDGPRHGIVVGADGTNRSDAALGFAFRQASLRALPLTVVHAYWSEQGEGYPSEARPYEAADAEDMRLLIAESIAGLEADFPDVKVSLYVEYGFADSVVVHACKDAEMVVVGTHPTNALYDLLAGEVSRSVLGHARCAVAVVPDPT